MQSAVIQPLADQKVALSEVIAALSYALDITEGQPEGHAARSCLIAMRIAQELQLSPQQKSSLFYGTLLKDAGCSSNAAKVCSLFQADDRLVKKNMKTTEWTSKAKSFQFVVNHAAPEKSVLGRAAQVLKLAMTPESEGTELVRTRCSRGADIARKFGFDEQTAEIVHGLDEHFDGHGEPDSLQGDQIPLLARIACLAQTLEVFHADYDTEAAIRVANDRSGTWFDPELVRVANSFDGDGEFWNGLQCSDIYHRVAEVEPKELQVLADEDRLDDLAEGFADVVDAKSPWTFHHSQNVADVTVGGLSMLGYSVEEQRYWRRAGLLHDIGKLGVSNMILDKPGRLTDDEFAQVKKHTVYTQKILSRVSCFKDFAEIAAAHHERIDGKGYHLGLSDSQITTEARVMAVADVYDALSAKRPYRNRVLTQDEVFAIIDDGSGTQFCPKAIDAVKAFLGYVG